MQVFRDIGQFEQRTAANFGNWLARIADNRLCDAIKQHDRAKHGGNLQQLENAAGHDSSLVSLWDWLAAADTSPDSIVSREEAVQALRVALAGLPHDQQMAIRIRFLEGKSLSPRSPWPRTPAVISSGISTSWKLRPANLSLYDAHYRDPFGAVSSKYARRWPAGRMPVRVRDNETGLSVIVQESYDKIIGQPLSQMRQGLILLSLITFGFSAAVIVPLWGVILRLVR